MHPIAVAVVAALAKELGGLPEVPENAQRSSFHGELLVLGGYCGKTLLVSTLGFGKVNAGITMAALLERFTVAQVWHVGCSGAYEQSPLQLGDVVITNQCICGDEGVITAAGSFPQQEIGIPLLVTKGRKYFDTLPADESLLSWVQTLTPAGRYRLGREPSSSGGGQAGLAQADGAFSPLPPAGVEQECFNLAHGPSLTVSLASGDREVAAERFERYGSWAENMEGSAVAQTCLRFGVPMIECRGISNQAGDRDKQHWQMDKAISHCSAIVCRWLQIFACSNQGPAAI
jgi:futalosine hydrolase